MLVSSDGQYEYPIRNFIPRFVEAANYAATFGFQWLKHNNTQYDEHSGTNASEKRFFEESRWPRKLRGEVILEAGSGAGIFTEHAANTGAMVISFDYSVAVEANYAHNGHRENLLLVQANIFAMPFDGSYFDRVICIGVLQHTPDPRRAFDCLAHVLKGGGALCVDIYRVSPMTLTKYMVRPYTRTIESQALYEWCERHVERMWVVARLVRRIPRIGPYLNWLLLVADYSAWYTMDDAKLKQWAVLNTFDMLSPRYDKPRNCWTVRRWFTKAGFACIDVHNGYNGVEGRGTKPKLL